MSEKRNIDYLINNKKIGKTGFTIRQMMDRNKPSKQPELTEDLAKKIFEIEKV